LWLTIEELGKHNKQAHMNGVQGGGSRHHNGKNWDARDLFHKSNICARFLGEENKSGFTRFFLGSVTKYVAIHCQVPLIIVPETQPTK